MAGLGAAVQGLGESLTKIEQSRLVELLSGSAREAALSPDKIVEQLTERPDLTVLAAEAIDAARRTTLNGKAAALGKCLGAILNDDALIDLESIWIRIVATVEPPHIRVLKFLLEHTGTMGTGSTLWGTGPVMTITEMGQRLGLDEAVFPLVQDLVGAGLVTTQGIPSPVSTDPFDQPAKATRLGAQLFARLSDASL